MPDRTDVPQLGLGCVKLGSVATGGSGCAQLRLIFGSGGGGAEVMTGRGVKVRGRTGGGGCVPAGTPRASRKRRTLSSSLTGGARRGASLGGSGGGVSALSDPLLVSHLKRSASPARTKKMMVSFIWRSDE